MFEGEFDGHIGSDLKKLIDKYELMLIDQDVSFFEEEEFEQIIDYYEDSNKLDSALKAVNLAVSQYPFSGLFLVKKAELLFELKLHQQALEVLAKAEIYDASDLEIYLLRSEISTASGEYSAAVKTLKVALGFAEEEEKDELFLSMADVYEAWEKFDKVFECLQKALHHNPLNEDALNKIWFSVNITGKQEQSIKLHEKLINQNPYSYLAWYNLGQAYFSLGLYEKAAEAFEYVLLINEDYDMVYRDLGETFIRMEQYQKAIEIFEEALKIAEPYEELYFGLGWCFEKMKDYGKARFNYRKAAHIDPYYDQAFFRIGVLYQREGRNTEAINSYKKALQLNEENADVLIAFADICAEEGKLDLAIANLKKGLHIKPQSPDTWLKLAHLLFEVDDKEGALEVISQATRLFGEDARFAYFQSAFLFAAGKRNEAMHTLEKALILSPRDFETLFSIVPQLKGDPTVCEIIEQYLS